MLYRINRFSINQTSRIAGVVYFAIGILMIPFFLAGTFADPAAGVKDPSKLSPFFFVAIPFIYGLLGYVMTALMLYIYNLTARRIGGIELDIVYAVEPPVGIDDTQTSAIPSVVPPDSKLH